MSHRKKKKILGSCSHIFAVPIPCLIGTTDMQTCFELKPPQESGDFCFQKQGQTIKDILRSNGFLPYCILRKWLGASMAL